MGCMARDEDDGALALVGAVRKPSGATADAAEAISVTAAHSDVTVNWMRRPAQQPSKCVSWQRLSCCCAAANCMVRRAEFAFELPRLPERQSSFARVPVMTLAAAA